LGAAARSEPPSNARGALAQRAAHLGEEREQARRDRIEGRLREHPPEMGHRVHRYGRGGQTADPEKITGSDIRGGRVKA
jgi:hypothetical protein